MVTGSSDGPAIAPVTGTTTSTVPPTPGPAPVAPQVVPLQDNGPVTGTTIATETETKADGAGNRSGNPPDDCATNTVGIPSSSDTKLQNYIDQLYKHANKPGTVGNGTTMDAIPGEIAAGGGRHIQKGEEIARGLRNWLSRNPNAPYCDRLLAQSLYDELVNALGYEPS